jgi:DNA polymerase-3 subunit delta'
MPYKADRALEMIDRARGSKRLGHAYLITGPKEAKREQFAARLLNLVSGQKHRDLDSWQLTGIPIVTPGSKSRRITIDSMRGLQHAMHMRTAADGYKFGVVVDAERMTTEAQNAFLKTLEEPPPGALLLLLTGKPEELLPTTLSRVIQIELIPEDGARQFNEHELKLLALLEAQSKRATSSMAGALNLKAAFEEVLEELYEGIEEDAEEGLDKEKEHFQKTTDSSAFFKDREKQVEAKIESTYLHQRDTLLELLLSWMGDIIRHKVGGERLDLPTHAEATKAIAERTTIEDASRRLRALTQLEKHLHTNVNENLALEVCFVQAFG